MFFKVWHTTNLCPTAVSSLSKFSLNSSPLQPSKFSFGSDLPICPTSFYIWTLLLLLELFQLIECLVFLQVLFLHPTTSLDEKFDVVIASRRYGTQNHVIFQNILNMNQSLITNRKSQLLWETGLHHQNVVGLVHQKVDGRVVLILLLDRVPKVPLIKIWK